MSDTPRTDAATFKATRIGSALSENVVCVDDAKRLEHELEKAEAENAALRKDAERYRWLRDTHKQGAKNPHGEGIVVVTDRPSKEPRYIGPLGWELLDTAIDAAM